MQGDLPWNASCDGSYLAIVVVMSCSASRMTACSANVYVGYITVETTKSNIFLPASHVKARDGRRAAIGDAVAVSNVDDASKLALLILNHGLLPYSPSSLSSSPRRRREHSGQNHRSRRLRETSVRNHCELYFTSALPFNQPSHV